MISRKTILIYFQKHFFLVFTNVNINFFLYLLIFYVVLKKEILEYVAADISSNVESITQMMLITDYHSLGSLYDYLREQRCFCINKNKSHITQASVSLTSRNLSFTTPSGSYEVTSSSSLVSCSFCLLSLNEALQLAYR